MVLSAETVINLAFLEYLSNLEISRQQAVVMCRDYFDGNHPTYLTKRIEEFLGLHGKKVVFRLNLCRSVIAAVSERLSVIGFNTSEQVDAEGIKAQAEWARQVWQHNRMDAKQVDIHDGALRDGEYFIIVDWDNQASMPRWNLHPRWTDTLQNGDGFGCRMIYPDEDINQPAICAVKEWSETLWNERTRTTRRRRTVYYPSRIERYFYDASGWKPFTELSVDGLQPTWPTPWVDALGKPLGIPVIHVKNKELRSEMWDAIPMQDALNKALIDVIATGDLTAFRVFAAFGWIPTTDGKEPNRDGSNWLYLQPGQVIGTTRTKAEADFKAIDGADMTSMIETVNQIIFWLAMVTDTPVSRYVSTKQVASGDTLKEQREPLDAKIDMRKVLFGNAYEDAIVISRKLANMWGSANLDEEVQIETLWDDRRNLDELEAKLKIGIPREQLWLEAGYSQEQIQAMKQTDEYKARLANQQAASVMGEMSRKEKLG